MKLPTEYRLAHGRLAYMFRAMQHTMHNVWSSAFGRKYVPTGPGRLRTR